MQFNTISKKIGMGFLGVIAVLAFISLVTVWQVGKSTTSFDRVHDLRVPTANASAKLLNGVNRSLAALRGWMLLSKEDFVHDRAEAWNDEIKPSLSKLDILSRNWTNPENQSRLARIKEDVKKFETYQSEVENLTREKKKSESIAVLSGKAAPVADKIRADLKAMVENQGTLMEKDFTSYQQTVSFLNTLVWILLVVGAALGALIALYVTRTITTTLRENVVGIAQATRQILAATAQQASGAQEQATSVSETVSTVSEVAQTASQSAERVQAVTDMTNQSEKTGQEGKKVVEQAVTAMSEAKRQSEQVGENILNLAQKSQSIGQIINSVKDITDQTNLLALNASIEASRAGEHGKGFSVVANEIKNLADQAKSATAEIAKILEDIQKGTNNAVISTEESNRKVSAASNAITEAGHSISSLSQSITEASQAAMQIAAAANQQTTGMAQVTAAIRNIETVARQTLASTAQNEQAVRALDQVGEQLLALIDGSERGSTGTRYSSDSRGDRKEGYKSSFLHESSESSEKKTLAKPSALHEVKRNNEKDIAA